MSKVALLYHFPCTDGFGASYVFWKKFKDDLLLFPIQPNADIPDIPDDVEQVFMADIALDREKTLELKRRHPSLIVLDHHLSNKDVLEDLEFCHFDMNHSGAMLAWLHLFPDEDPPLLIKLVEDRDIWKWEIADSHKLLLAIDSYEMSFGKWSFLEQHLQTEAGYNRLLAEGKAIERFRRFLFNDITRHVHKRNIGGVKIDCINMATFLKGDFASFMLDEFDLEVASAYYFNGKKYTFSLRSKESVNVAKIAEMYGGGGHAQAAAFQIESLADLEIRWWKRQWICLQRIWKRITRHLWRKP